MSKLPPPTRSTPTTEPFQKQFNVRLTPLERQILEAERLRLGLRTQADVIRVWIAGFKKEREDEQRAHPAAQAHQAHQGHQTHQIPNQAGQAGFYVDEVNLPPSPTPETVPLALIAVAMGLTREEVLQEAHDGRLMVMIDPAVDLPPIITDEHVWRYAIIGAHELSQWVQTASPVIARGVRCIAELARTDEDISPQIRVAVQDIANLVDLVSLQPPAATLPVLN